MFNMHFEALFSHLSAFRGKMKATSAEGEDLMYFGAEVSRIAGHSKLPQHCGTFDCLALRDIQMSRENFRARPPPLARDFSRDI